MRKQIKKALTTMSDNALRKHRDTLMTTKPKAWGSLGWSEYWNEKYRITMEEWAVEVLTEMKVRQLT